MRDATESRHFYIWNRLLLQLAPGLVNARHRHFGAFLLLAPDAPIEIEVDRCGPVIAHAALVAQNAWHRLDSRRSRVATLLVGPDHPWFGHVTPALRAASVVTLDHARIAGGVDWDRLFDGRETCADVRAFVERTLKALSGAAFAPHALDPQVAAVVDMINENCERAPNAAMLARSVGLSTVTLMRRFKRELGVRIREYALWRRLLSVVRLIDGRRTLTDIAQLVGFYDQAHLTRTSRRMFDLQPSSVSGLNAAIVHACEDRRF